MAVFLLLSATHVEPQLLPTSIWTFRGRLSTASCTSAATASCSAAFTIRQWAVYRLPIENLHSTIVSMVAEPASARLIAGDFNLPGIYSASQFSEDDYETHFLNTLVDGDLAQWADSDTRGSRILDLVCTGGQIDHLHTETVTTRCPTTSRFFLRSN